MDQQVQQSAVRMSSLMRSLEGDSERTERWVLRMKNSRMIGPKLSESPLIKAVEPLAVASEAATDQSNVMEESDWAILLNGEFC